MDTISTAKIHFFNTKSLFAKKSFQNNLLKKSADTYFLPYLQKAFGCQTVQFA